MVHRTTVKATDMQPGLVPEVRTVADVMPVLWYEGLAGFTHGDRSVAIVPTLDHALVCPQDPSACSSPLLLVHASLLQHPGRFERLVESTFRLHHT